MKYLTKCKVFDFIIAILLLVCILLLIAGCNNIPVRPEYYQNKLDSIIKTDSTVGAIGLYNSQKLNSPYIIGQPPMNSKLWMDWHIMNIKLGKNIYLE